MVSERQFKQCLPPCPRYIMGGHTHKLYVHCLGVEHSLGGCLCPPCSVRQSRLVHPDVPASQIVGVTDGAGF